MNDPQRQGLLVITPDFPPRRGGIQTLMDRLCRNLRTWSPTVIAPDGPGATEHDRTLSYPVTRVGPGLGRGKWRRALFLVAALFRALQIARRQRAQVVLCAHVLVSPVAWLTRCWTGVPYVVYVHANELLWMSRLATPLRCGALGAADRVIAVSRYAANLAARVGADPGRIAVIGHGADLREPGASAAGPGPGSGSPAGGRTVVTVSRMEHPYKGHDVLIRSLPMVAARVADVSYVLIGTGRLEGQYQQLARALGVADRVRFLGEVSDAVREMWLETCDVFALVSRASKADGGAEGFGIVYLEAGAHGKPVVAGNAGGAPDAVEDGVSGLLVSPEDPVEVAGAIVRLLEDRDLARQLGEGGRRRVLEQHRWETVARRVEGLLEEVLGKSSQRTAPAA